MGGSAHKATQHAHNAFEDTTNHTHVIDHRSMMKDADSDFFTSKDADADH